MIRLLTCLAFLLNGVIASAEPATTQPVDQSNWPKHVTVSVGDLRTRIEGEKMWTMSGVEFQGRVIATQDSAYGTVLTIRNVGHLGTAHFLDAPGKPGEVEKEDVTSLQFFVDDKPVTRFTPDMTLSGKSFMMKRTSAIRAIALESSTALRDNMLIETAHLRGTGEIDVVKAHPLMYAFTPAATHYAIGDGKGITQRGEFLKEGKTGNAVFQSPRWIAVYDAKAKEGAVCVLVSPDDPKCSFLLVDAPGVYRKFALYTQVDQVLSRGFDARYLCGVGVFSGDVGEWEMQALKRAREVESNMSRP